MYIMMEKGTDSDLCTILGETVDMYPNIRYIIIVLLMMPISTGLVEMVIQLLETFKDINEEQYDKTLTLRTRLAVMSIHEDFDRY